MAFPLSEEEWYLQRDDRTKRVDSLAGFESYRAGILVTEEAANVFQSQVMMWMLANMMARWCRTIDIEIRDSAIAVLNPIKGQNLKLALQNELLKIDPYLRLRFRKIQEENVDGILVIGASGKADFNGKTCWIDCDGWLSGIGLGSNRRAIRQRNDHNIIGAGFAAALGCAELFRRAVGKEAMKQEEQWYSLLNFEKSLNPSALKNAEYPDSLEFGHIHQPGCGAVGASFDYLLSLTDWRGSIDLIDYDKVQASNCNRSLPFNAYHAIDEKLKIEICNEILKSNLEIRTRIFPATYSDFIKEKNYLKPAPDLILCFANQGTIWSDIQNNLPPLVFHATTTPNWGINFGRHIPKKEWCILCRFHKEAAGKHHFNPVCGTGDLQDEHAQDEPVQGVLPFLSPMSALLVFAELAKTALPSYPANKNFVQFSSKSPEGQFSMSQSLIREACICNEQLLDVYLPVIKKTRHWYLVEN